MARRRGAIAAPAEEPQLPGLAFNETLSWRPGKAIPTNVLLQRLSRLSKELMEMDQEESDKDSLTKVAKELAGPNLLHHKDPGVRAYTACCLVDVFRVCAPDAPFTSSQSKDIFTLLVTSILPALSNPSDEYNMQHMYVLQSLAEVKSIVLLADVSNADALIPHLFSSFFDIVSGTSNSRTGEQLSKNAEFYMNQVLVTLVDEAGSLPSGVIDIIVAQFLRAASSTKPHGDAKHDDRQSTLQLKELPAAYKMAEFLCDSCPDKMSRYISQYFNDVIVDASSTAGLGKTANRARSSANSDSDDEDGIAGPTEADLRELNKAHRLLRELWRASAQVLQNVIPQLEAELYAENIQLRLLATETLGDIVSGIGAAGPPPMPAMDPAAYPPMVLDDYSQSPVSTNILTTPMSPQSFAQSYPSVYGSFLSRKNDKSPVIRSAWTTAIGRITVTSAGGIGLSREDEVSLVSGLAEKLNDPDERVRIAAVKAVRGFGFPDIATKLTSNGGVDTPGSILCSLADRSRDRKHAVRVEGMTTISRIWGVAAGEIAADEVVASLLGGIPSRIFHAYYANDQDVNVLLDHVMFEQLLPLSYPPSKSKSPKKANGEAEPEPQPESTENHAFDPNTVRVERLLVLVRSLDAKAKKAFFALQARQKTYRDVMTTFLRKCEEYNGGVMDRNEQDIKRKLTQVIQWLVQLLPDQPRASADLWRFAKMHDRRAYHLIRCTMDPMGDFKTVYKAFKEFSKRIEAAPGAPPGLLDTLVPLIYRAGSIVYNQSNLPAILEFSRNDAKGLRATAHELLKEISERNPDIFKAQVNDLCKLLVEDAPTATKPNDIGSFKTLKACAGFARKFPGEIPKGRPFVQALISFAKHSIPAKAAKYAVTILLSTSDRKDMHAKDLLQWSIKDWAYGSDHHLNKLAVISQVTLLAPGVVDEVYDEILNIASVQVIKKFRTPANAEDPSWVDESALDEECQAKCWAIKALVNRLRVVNDPADAKELAHPIFLLLNALISKEGDLLGTGETPKHHRSRLRLLAAHLILKLCRVRVLEDLVKPEAFNRLATVAQDSLFQVRRGFIEKLEKYLVQLRLPSRFYTIVFLMAFEPEPVFLQTTTTWVRSRAKFFQDKKVTTMEAIFPRLLSLLAHHPDYSPRAEDLKDTAQYLLFYISTIANEDNIGLIYKYAERAKQARDAVSPNESQGLYVLSDLAQSVLRKWESRKGWTLQVYAGKVGLTKDLFLPMPDHSTAQETADTNFLPEEMDDLLDDVVRMAERKGKAKRKIADDGAQPSKKPRQAPAKKAAKPKTPAKKPKKSKPESSSSSTIPDSARRRSGRSAAARSYADRDDSQDEEEMMEGVSKWEYEDGHLESGNEDDEAGSGSEKGESGRPAEQEEEPEQEKPDEDVAMTEAAQESSEAAQPRKDSANEKASSSATDPGEGSSPPLTDLEETPEPPMQSTPEHAERANGKGKRASARKPAAEPAPKAKPSAASPSKPKGKGKAPVRAKAPTRGSARNRSKAVEAEAERDVFDMDSD